MATPSKAQLLTNVHDLLKKRYKPKADRGQARLTILEAVVYGICHEGMSRQDANTALTRFKERYFDWNEVRVSSLVEIQGTLEGFPDSEERARRIRKFLRQMFQKTYGFTLEALLKKPLKDALKVLQEYEAFSSDFVTATVIQQALGGHAMPLDEDIHRVLGRLGIDESDPVALRSALERAVPKNRGVEFLDLLEDLAHDTCVPGIPECPRCELRKICPYPAQHKEVAAAAKSGSTKPGIAKEPAPPATAKPAKAVVKEAPATAQKAATVSAKPPVPIKSVRKQEEPAEAASRKAKPGRTKG